MLPELEKAFTDCTSQEIHFDQIFKRMGKVNLKHFGAEHLNLDGAAMATCAKDVVEMLPIATEMAVTFLNGDADKAVSMVPWAKAFQTISDCKQMIRHDSPDLIIIE